MNPIETKQTAEAMRRRPYLTLPFAYSLLPPSVITFP